ncbi:CbtA family protein [Kitasatospora sp. NPDC091207]|uniref:CbtA family protein n=1 Tax=Kitasatospora sp. NPDC091207 TaxID=3364083 RepID=UPI0037FF1EC1
MNSSTVRSLLVRGMLAGLAAGLLALLTAYFLGESHVDAAIAFEEAHSAHHGMDMEPELVSRSLQSTAGLATGILLFAVAMGGIASLAFCFALGRIGRFGARATAVVLSLGALVTVYLVPFVKYPANPPSVGDPDTIGKRTLLYFLMLLLAVLLAVAAVIAGKRLAPRLGNWYASVAAGAGFVLAVGLAYALLPTIDEVPEEFPATLLWQFRLAALAIQVVLWSSFGLVFGELAERVLKPRPATAQVPARAAAAVQ